ncbi:MAG: hypothetical protein NTZ44_03865 [Candidatus Nomurabacteria bacterium]|nr:hypothetical protein [Candidatus Nomurabacteria bacterium]
MRPICILITEEDYIESILSIIKPEENLLQAVFESAKKKKVVFLFDERVSTTPSKIKKGVTKVSKDINLSEETIYDLITDMVLRVKNYTQSTIVPGNFD